MENDYRKRMQENGRERSNKNGRIDMEVITPCVKRVNNEGI